MDAAQLRAQAALYLKLSKEYSDRSAAEAALAIALDYFERARDAEDAKADPLKSSG